MASLAEIKKLVIVEPDRCTSCKICEIICSLLKTETCNPARSRIRVMSNPFMGVDVPIICLHCETPLCRDVCPVRAITTDAKTGIVVLDEEACFGCRLCMMVCPYGAITFDPRTGKVAKCDLCGGDPMCVKYCQPEAIRYIRGDLAVKRAMRSAMERVAEPILKARERE